MCDDVRVQDAVERIAQTQHALEWCMRSGADVFTDREIQAVRLLVHRLKDLGTAIAVSGASNSTTAETLAQASQFIDFIRLQLSRGQLLDILGSARTTVTTLADTLERDSAMAGSKAQDNRRSCPQAPEVPGNQDVRFWGNISGNAKVIVNQNGNSAIDTSAITDFLEQTRAVQHLLPPPMSESLLGLLAKVEGHLDKPTPNEGTLRQLLLSARSVCENATGNIVAAGLIATINSIL